MYRGTWETLIHTNIDTNKDGKKSWCKVLNVRWTGKGYRNWTSSKSRNCGHLKIMWRGVYHRGNQKIYQKFQHLFKANLILLANAPTPGQCTDSWPCPASRRVATCRPIAFCSWSTESFIILGHHCVAILLAKMLIWGPFWQSMCTFSSCINPCLYLI